MKDLIKIAEESDTQQLHIEPFFDIPEEEEDDF